MNYTAYHSSYNEKLAFATSGLIAHYSQSANWPSATTSRSAYATNNFIPYQLQGQTDWHAYEPQNFGACTGVKQISQVRGAIGVDRQSSHQSSVQEKVPSTDFPVNTVSGGRSMINHLIKNISMRIHSKIRLEDKTVDNCIIRINNKISPGGSYTSLRHINHIS